MKIYCIKIDTMPYIPRVLEYNKLVQGEFRRMVSGCYTLASTTMQFTGKLTSKLEPHGYGHWLWQDKKDTNGKVNWSWKKELVLHHLKEKGYKLHLRNWTEFLTYYGMEDDFSSVSSILDGREGKWECPYRWSSEIALKHTLGQSEDVEDSEKEYIQSIQKEKGDNFYFVNYNHFHIACQWSERISNLKKNKQLAGEKVGKLLSFWDFNEPDAFFWVYSDHGYWFHPLLGKFPEPCHFLTWALIRDNTLTKLTIPEILSIQDFKAHVISKLEETKLKERDVFFTEDGRDIYSPKSMSTAVACSFDHNKKIDIAAYHSTTDEWYGSNLSLQNRLKKEFDWVPK